MPSSISSICLVGLMTFSLMSLLNCQSIAYRFSSSFLCCVSAASTFSCSLRSRSFSDSYSFSFLVIVSLMLRICSSLPASASSAFACCDRCTDSAFALAAVTLSKASLFSCLICSSLFWAILIRLRQSVILSLVFWLSTDSYWQTREYFSFFLISSVRLPLRESCLPSLYLSYSLMRYSSASSLATSLLYLLFSVLSSLTRSAHSSFSFSRLPCRPQEFCWWLRMTSSSYLFSRVSPITSALISLRASISFIQLCLSSSSLFLLRSLLSLILILLTMCCSRRMRESLTSWVYCWL